MVEWRRKSIVIDIGRSLSIMDHFTIRSPLYHPLSFCIPFRLFVLSTNRPHAMPTSRCTDGKIKLLSPSQ